MERHYESYDIGESIAVLEQEITTIARQQRDESQALRTSIRETLSLVEKQGAEFRGEMRALGEQFASSQRTNWPLVIAFLTLMVALIGGGWVIIKQQTDNTVLHSLNEFGNSRSEVTSKLRMDLDANTARDEVSITERRKHEQEISALRADMNTAQSNQLVTNAKLAEVETQFRADAQARNVQFAEQQRMNNILMQLAQGVHPIIYPTSPYYMPSIAGDGAGH